MINDFSGESMATFTGNFCGASAGYDALVEFSFAVEEGPLQVQFRARSLARAVFRVTPESSGTFRFHARPDRSGVATFYEETVDATPRLDGTLTFSPVDEGTGGVGTGPTKGGVMKLLWRGRTRTEPRRAPKLDPGLLG